MAAREDDLDFDESGLDQLPQSTLQNLESNAISSTQRSVAANRQRQYRETTRAFRLTRPRSPVSVPVPSAPVPAPELAVAPTPAPAAPSSPGTDYGFDDDEEVFDLNDPTIQFQPDVSTRVPLTDAQSQNHAVPVHSNDGDQILPDDDPPEYSDIAATRLTNNDSAVASRMQELELTSNELKMSLQTAESMRLKQAGEISILRAKQEKIENFYENKILALQKSHADEIAKQKADMDLAKKGLETSETNNRFLEHDLAQAKEERSKRFKGEKPNTSRLSRQSSQSLPYRDGFDDHEIVLVSPSKPKDKPKPATPKVGEKRKRDAVVSPAPRLQLNGPPSVSPISVSNSIDMTSVKDELAQLQDASHAQFQMIQRLVNHRPFNSRERALETLSRLSYPSLPDQSISGLISEGLSRYSGVNMDDDFASFACNLFSDLWERCLQDSFYTPMFLILDLFEFVLAMAVDAPKMSLIERFIPLATRTIDLVAVPRVRSISGTKVDPNLLSLVDVDQILSMMHNMAFDASAHIESCQTFWTKIEFDFALMMLNKNQPLPQIMLVLQMVGTSVMPETFSIISENPEKQPQIEIHTIDRLTTLLFEQPEAPPDEPPYEDTEITALQIETIRVLNSLAGTKHGSEVLAQHKTAIGRLVRLLHVHVTKLYDLPATTIKFVEDAVEANESSTIHDLTTVLINLTIRLIHHLLIQYSDLINLREKLIVIPGGHHKFLVSLTRLAFSDQDQQVYEAGIEYEAVDAAHEILDTILSPEEGDAVMQAIQTPRGTNGTRASMPA